jgi:hypothetical protein
MLCINEKRKILVIDQDFCIRDSPLGEFSLYNFDDIHLKDGLVLDYSE